MKLIKSISLFVFIIVALCQWFVPVKMITHQNDILNTGKLFKFKTAPVDPYDAFRGKYIYLNFENTFVKIKNNQNFSYNENVYLSFSDSLGYAKIKSISRKKPNNSNCLKVKIENIGYVNNQEENNIKKIFFSYPFDRYYMNENKSQEAENVYAESVNDTKQKTYALVAIKDGESVLKDVMVNDISIKDYVKKANPN